MRQAGGCCCGGAPGSAGALERAVAWRSCCWRCCWPRLGSSTVGESDHGSGCVSRHSRLGMRLAPWAGLAGVGDGLRWGCWVSGLPSGAVTFLFSDMEGSTQLVKALRERYAEVLAEHRRLVRAAIAAHAGHEVDT